MPGKFPRITKGLLKSSVAKNRLDGLLINAVLAPAYERNRRIVEIREYIRAIGIEQFKMEMSVITSPAELRILQAAGVPGGAFDQFSVQIEKASGR